MGRRLVVLVGAAVAALALALVPAGVAQAAPQVSVGCATYDGLTYFSISEFTSENFPFDAGDTLTLSFSDPRDGATSAALVVGSASRSADIPGSVSYTFPAAASEFRVVAAPTGGLVTVAFTCVPAGPADTPPVPGWVQEYARVSADAMCADGWLPSWSRWPAGGAGGFVCVRSVPAFG